MPNPPHTVLKPTDALEPCPFGCDAEPYRHESDFFVLASVAIGCSKCGALGPMVDCEDEQPTEADWVKAEEAWNSRAARPEPQHHVIDLEKTAYQSLVEAAGQSSWIPPEYMANDWIADCREFLRTGQGITAEPQQDVVELFARIQTALAYDTTADDGTIQALVDARDALQALQVPELPKWEGDVERLVELLREGANGNFPVHPLGDYGVCDEAADLIVSLLKLKGECGNG